MVDHWSAARLRTAATLALFVILSGVATRAQSVPAARRELPKTVRLYVFDCGVLIFTPEDVQTYHVTPTEVGETRMSVPCFLIAHPRGTLMWDVGVIADESIGSPPEGRARAMRTLRSQLAEIGYNPADITYLAFSHSHFDHTANANEFASSTWLVRQSERDFMWAENNTRVRPSFYNALKNSKTIILDKDEYDVFGDGRVVIKSAPGHTPGHQVLVLRLGTTGRVMLSGDLYHYPPERTLRRAPPDNEASVQQSAASRMMIEKYLQKTKTELWIEHDFAANAKLKKAPAYYE
jgi:N-acyl homoserine lactone hydrolase